MRVNHRGTILILEWRKYTEPYGKELNISLLEYPLSRRGGSSAEAPCAPGQCILGKITDADGHACGRAWSAALLTYARKSAAAIGGGKGGFHERFVDQAIAVCGRNIRAPWDKDRGGLQ